MAIETPLDLAARWEREAVLLRAYGCVAQADTAGGHARELREALRAQDGEVLTLAEASLLSGYSVDRLRHLVSDAVIPNAGQRGSPRIRRADLPMKAGHDPEAIRAAARLAS